LPAPLSQEAQLGNARHNIGLAAEEDASVLLSERRETGIGARIFVARLPSEAPRCDAEMGEAGLDGGECGKMELDAIGASLTLNGLHGLGRLLCEVDELAVGPVGEARVAQLEIAQDRDDDLLTEVFGEVDLALTFRRVERFRRGEQDHHLAGGISLAERLAPALAGPDVVEVDEDIVLAPTIGHEPALEGESWDVVFAGMGKK